MGIRALCAAAAVVVAGVGAVDAATVDHVKLTLNAEYICEEGECGEPAPSISSFRDIPIGSAIYGDLVIGDRDEDLFQIIQFVSKGTTYHLGRFLDWQSTGNYIEDAAMDFFYWYQINWNGSEGSLRYRDDNVPWSLEVQGTIELAPVPLPATAALLPLGIVALAMLRRRRRSEAGSIAPREA